MSPSAAAGSFVGSVRSVPASCAAVTPGVESIYSPLSPFTFWKLEFLREDNEGIDFSRVTSIRLKFWGVATTPSSGQCDILQAN